MEEKQAAGTAASRVPAPQTGHGRKRRRVLLLTPSRPSGDFPASTYIRLLRPLTHESVADMIEILPVGLEAALTEPAHALVVQRTAIPDERSAEALLRRCRAAGLRKVFELDDDLLENPPEFLRHTEGFAERRAAARLFASGADAITVTTPALHALLDRMFAAPVYLLPNALDERLWLKEAPTTGGSVLAATHHAIHKAGRLLRRQAQIRLLYMGTASHHRDLQTLREPVERLKREYGRGVRLDVIGATNEESNESWFGLITIPRYAQTNYPAFVGWLRGLTGYQIGVAPLLDSPFNRAKSNLKYLDYCGLGLAPVVSDGPSFEGIVAHGETGFLVSDSVDAWYATLRQLIEEESIRECIRANARADLIGNHTLAAQAVERRTAWCRILDIDPDNRFIPERTN
ncbi:glycosyltransferase [Pelagibius sp.]|uniref:glycosyltransferase n=1 Tax=Pelagibius sp. TaxID=1931238 RepID=UPI002629FDEF|nr:glycosyltransferase [Pelagibius sp.]